MAEDQVFLCKILMKNNQISFCDEIVYNYVNGGLNQLTKNNAALEDLCKSLNLILDMFKEAELTEKAILKLFISKQFITLLKRGDYSLRIKATSSLIKLPIDSIFSILFQVIRISIILKYREKVNQND